MSCCFLIRQLRSVLLLLPVALCAQEIIVRPYVQPGDGTSLDGADVKVIAWVTNPTPGDYVVEFGQTGNSFDHTVRPQRIALAPTATQQYLKYAAILPGLPFDAVIRYRVVQGEKEIGAGQFATRRSLTQPLRFVVVGDAADGKPDYRRIAYQISRVQPHHLLMVGDIVYNRGLVGEYAKKFWPVYNHVTVPSPENGAPLLRSTVLYPILGNHDTGLARAPETPGDPGWTTLDKFEDGLAAFYFFHPPLNGPKRLNSYLPHHEKPFPTTLERIDRNPRPGFLPVMGPPERVAAFLAAAGTTYPALSFYSFDSGPVHFLCVDANRYTNPDDPLLREWIRADLQGSRAPWKTVYFHQPAFSASIKHVSEQQMRRLAPLFEECGVSVVFAGHVHNYQRTVPLKFQPRASLEDGETPGTFTLDDRFDGKSETRPEGIIYIVTGGGGAGLNDPELTENPAKFKLLNGEPNFNAKFISDRHSFSVVDATPAEFVLRQIDANGTEIDRVRLTRP